MNLKRFSNNLRMGFMLLGFLACTLILWFAGPLISFGSVSPLESPAWRLVAALILALFLVLREIHAKRSAQNREAEMASALRTPEHGSLQTDIDGKVAALNHQFSQALERLLSQSNSTHRRFRLYEVPWYLMIGPPGSGKTTILTNSGLKFPLADRGERLALKGVAGTRNCDWFFTDEAILIDTAGRYTSQDSHGPVDAAEWSGFMNLLKKYRPRQPINGILVTLSFMDLMQQSETERNLLAKSLRQRILELYQTLGLTLPVYLILTKADLISGFNDFFANFDSEARKQVWGATNPDYGPSNTETFLEGLDQRLEQLLSRLSGIAVGRLQDERTVEARTSILAFPDQIALTLPTLRNLIHSIFSSNRYEDQILFRGFYITSATQEGTPIDRVMGILSQRFGLSDKRPPFLSGIAKSFFTKGLFSNVVFPEASLTGVDQRLERRQRLIGLSMLGAIGATLVLCIGLWTASYIRNQALIDKFSDLLAQYEAQELHYGGSTEASVQRSGQRLEALQKAYFLTGSTPLLNRLGLSQAQKLNQAVRHALDQELSTQFIPLIQRRLADRMAGEEGMQPEILYQLLRVYLMLEQPDRLQPELIRAWVGRDWERRFHADSALLANLMIQLDLAMEEIRAQRIKPNADATVIASARKKLTQVPLVTQIYLRFRDEHQAGKPKDLVLSQKLGEKFIQVFQSSPGGSPETLKIPGIFTVEGYKQFFLANSLDFLKQALTDNWILGEDRRMTADEIQRVYGEFRQVYLEDYARHWQNTLAVLKLKPASSLGETIDLLDVLSREDSPITRLLELIRDNTSNQRFSVTPTQGTPDEKMEKLVNAAANLTGESDVLESIENKITKPFEDLNKLVEKPEEKGSAPIHELNDSLKGLHDALMILSSFSSGGKDALKKAGERMAPGGNDAISAAKLVISRLPQPLRGWLMPLTTLGWSLMLEEAKKTLAGGFDADVKPACKTLGQGAYPLNPTADVDLSLLDFGKVFNPTGPLEKFFSEALLPFLEETPGGPRVIRRDDRSMPINPETVRRLHHAHQIREAYFPGGGTVPRFAFELMLLSLDARVREFDLDLQGQQLQAVGQSSDRIAVEWPGHAQASPVRASFKTLDGRNVNWERKGPWAFFRLLDLSQLTRISPELYHLTFSVQGYTASYELRTTSPVNPFSIASLGKFKCPETL